MKVRPVFIDKNGEYRIGDEVEAELANSQVAPVNISARYQAIRDIWFELHRQTLTADQMFNLIAGIVDAVRMAEVKDRESES